MDLKKVRVAVLVVVLLAVAVWVSLHFLQAAPPRQIVLASGPEFGVYHAYATRYKEILRREGVAVQERLTNGAAENLRLLADPTSGVEVAFMQGGVASSPAADDVVMLATLYYEPLWIFYRDAATLTKINELHGKRMAVGVKGSGTYALASQILSINGLTLADGIGRDNTDIVSLGGSEALDALKTGNVDAAMFVGGAQTPLIQRALGDLRGSGGPACCGSDPGGAARPPRGISRQRRPRLKFVLAFLRAVIILRLRYSVAQRESSVMSAKVRRPRDSWSSGLLRSTGRVSRHGTGGSSSVRVRRSAQTFRPELPLSLSAVLARRGRRAHDHCRRSSGCRPSAVVQLHAPVPALARAVTHLPLVRRARFDGA